MPPGCDGGTGSRLLVGPRRPGCGRTWRSRGGGLCLSGPPAFRQPRLAPVPPGVQTGADGVTLLDQSPWVERGHAFHLQLQIRASDPSHEYVALQEFNALVTRTGFDAALTGDIGEYTSYPPITVALSQLPV